MTRQRLGLRRPSPALWMAAGLLATALTHAAPDEEALNSAQGYPRAKTLGQAYTEPYRVGSFSAMDQIGPHCTLAAAAQPLPLPSKSESQGFRYRFAGQSYAISDYLQRQRATGLLVLKDGEIAWEGYNYDRRPDQRMLSNSMAKTIVALAIGQALDQGAIRSLDDTAATYVPNIAGTLLGDTPIRHLLRMSAGVQFVEDYSGRDDLARFHQVQRTQGTARAVATLTQREAPSGTQFHYVSPITQALGLVLRGATQRTLCEWVSTQLWQPMGAEAPATWLINPLDKVELASGNFNATVRDYARLGWLLANDGRRGDQQLVPLSYLQDMTDPQRQPDAFRPGKMNQKGSTYLGYGYQVWLLPGSSRRFVLLGVYGQALYVDPALKLVMVHTAVAKDAAGDASGHRLGAERDALWRGIVAHYGARW